MTPNGKPKCLKKTLSKCHFVHKNPTRTDLGLNWTSAKRWCQSNELYVVTSKYTIFLHSLLLTSNLTCILPLNFLIPHWKRVGGDKCIHIFRVFFHLYTHALHKTLLWSRKSDDEIRQIHSGCIVSMCTVYKWTKVYPKYIVSKTILRSGCTIIFPCLWNTAGPVWMLIFIVSTKKRNCTKCCYSANDVGETTCRSVKDLDAANRYKIQRNCSRSAPVELALCSLVCPSL